MWQKESVDDAIYKEISISNQCSKQLIDSYNQLSSTLMASQKQTLGGISTLNMKNNELSLQKREEGNDLFAVQKWDKAMELYNESLCLAENGSENIGLAYANRSACFLNLKLYNRCLLDIKLAEGANYPQHLLTKLVNRKATCLEMIQKGAEAVLYHPKLDFESDEANTGQTSVMSNVVKMENHRMLAKDDIDVGKTILIEKAFVTNLFTRRYMKCSICLKEDTNLAPCKCCTSVMFCHIECEENELHKFECGMISNMYDDTVNKIMRDIRIMVKVVKLFSSPDDLMAFVEGTIASDQKYFEDVSSDARSQYRSFLKLPFNDEWEKDTQFALFINCIYKILMNHPDIRQMFASQKHQRFLLHLIGHHSRITLVNAYITRPITEKLVNVNHHSDMHSHVGVMQCFFNHSCAPNVAMGSCEEYLLYTTIRPVKKDDQLLVLFDLNCLMEFSKEKRQQHLSIQRPFVCKCERCTIPSTASPMQIMALKVDSDFQAIILNFFNSTFAIDDKNEVNAMMQRCVAVLNKFGQIWCDELAPVLACYIFTIAAYRLTIMRSP